MWFYVILLRKIPKQQRYYNSNRKGDHRLPFRALTLPFTHNFVVITLYDIMGASTVSISRCGVLWLPALIGHVLLTALHTSWDAVTVILVVSELLASVRLRDGSLGLLGFNFNQRASQLYAIIDVSVIVCIV